MNDRIEAIIFPNGLDTAWPDRAEIIGYAIGILEDIAAGKKIVLQQRRKYWHQADPEKASGGDTSTWFVPCDKKENVWVEVADD